MRHALAALLLWLAAVGAGAADAAGNNVTDPTTGGDPKQQVLVLLQMAREHFRPDGNYSGSYGDGAGRSARRGIATELAREHGLTLVTSWPMPVLGADCFVMAVPAHAMPESVAQTLSRDRRVMWAQAMNVYQAQGRGHDDPLYAVQPAARAWHLSELHEVATGRGVRVAVVDSGVDESHPDLQGQVALAANFVDGRPALAEAHGTGVAGIIAARADNGAGIVGVAPQARVLALRACWQAAPESTLCTSLSLAMALHFAITHDAQIVNLSLSGPPDRLLASLLDVALARGITLVAPVDVKAANGGFPASHAGVVAVAAEHAPPGALLAPGRDVPTPVPGTRWQLVSGSSYAAAHVSGLYALLRELRGNAGARLPAAVIVLEAGGSIDTCATLSRASGVCVCGCAVAGGASPVSIPIVRQ